jgi:hypothetical protein
MMFLSPTSKPALVTAPGIMNKGLMWRADSHGIGP